MLNEETHPCFAATCTHYARVHLPVAPACNMQCNYCLRKYSCVNECRPGVTTKIMTPVEAAQHYCKLKKTVSDISVVGIAGPGDALANWQQVKETLQLIRESDDAVKFCLSTNGLLLPDYIEELAALGVRYLTVTVNCIDEALGKVIYDYIEYQGRRFTGQEAAKILGDRQLQGIRLAKKYNFIIKINSVAIADVNVKHLVEVARMAAEMRCEVMNIIPMIPVIGSRFGYMRQLAAEEVEEARGRCERYIRQMRHCRHCRADAVGRL